ncbi:hypothetical protein RHS01_05515 [Rhizoctonia solani]|uniref:Uncharacterized protein n=1 Tax=Rhizoctonia solani TaxID=456999 RepID=A0A8H7IAT3_9AGAM|nr:hypothetical protein RHS01_05515 [Rhizoctonia solani]
MHATPPEEVSDRDDRRCGSVIQAASRLVVGTRTAAYMLVAAASFIASSGSRLKLTFQAHTNSAMFSSAHLAFFAAAAAALVAASPVTELEGQTLAKRETSYGNPDLVTDQGNRFKLNFGSTDGHPNACPGHYICYISKNGAQHGDVSLAIRRLCR